MVITVVAGAGLAADRQSRAVCRLVGSDEAARGAFLDHARQRALRNFRHLMRHDAIGLRGALHDRLVRRGLGKAQPLDRDRRHPHPVIHDDAHQLGERVGPVARGADRGAERRHEMAERVAVLAPVFPDPLEGVLLDQDPDTGILLGEAAVEQPSVNILADIRTGVDDLVPVRAGMVLQIVDEPQFQRMNPRDIAAVSQRHLLRRQARIHFPELFLTQERTSEIGGEIIAEIGEPRIGMERQIDRGQGSRRATGVAD